MDLISSFLDLGFVQVKLFIVRYLSKRKENNFRIGYINYIYNS